MSRKFSALLIICILFLSTALVGAQQRPMWFENALQYLQYYTTGMDRIIPALYPLRQAAGSLQISIDNGEAVDESLLLLGLIYQEEGNTAEAKKVYRQYLERNPDAGWVYVLLGDAEYYSGDNTAALQNYVKALMIDDYARAYYGIGLINMEQGITSDVIAAFAKAVETAPEFVDARTILAKAYFAVDDYEAALTEFETAYLYAPRDAEIHYYLWQLYSLNGDQDKANHYRELAIQYNPEYASLVE
ncbi:MAG: tetratricopeptide repeat protein [Firmicutes bacterium]|nr:tetratricopeptide repeat protein [Bacillota bacterium]